MNNTAFTLPRISAESTLGDIVRTRPHTARVFEKLGLDYCCGGKRSLAAACGARRLDPATVAALLETLDGAPGPELVAADAMPLDDLCDHIVHAHHDHLRTELPRLDHMTAKVAAVHGTEEPRLVAIRRTFEAFARELASHMHDEETRVFPRIRALAAGNTGQDREGLRQAIDELEREHSDAGAALEQFRTLSDGFTPPEWACNTYRALFHALAELERDMHQHVHKENNVLFPRALAVS